MQVIFKSKQTSIQHLVILSNKVFYSKSIIRINDIFVIPILNLFTYRNEKKWFGQKVCHI